MRIILFFVIFILTTACTGQNLFPNPDDGTIFGTVNVSAVHHDENGEALEPTAEISKLFSTNQGFDVELTELIVHWEKVRLISEGEDPECVPGLDQEIALAEAEDFLAPDLDAVFLGSVAAGDSHWCKIAVTMGPAQVHAVKFHLGEGELPEGLSFHASGHWTQGAETGDFAIEGAHSVTIEMISQAMENGEVIDHPLHFHPGETEIDLTFGTEYTRLLDGIDLKNDTAEIQADKFSQNLRERVHQYLGEEHH